MSFEERITLPSIRDLFPEFFPTRTEEVTVYSPQMVDSPISDRTWPSPTLINTSTSTTQYHNDDFHNGTFNPNCLNCTQDLGKAVCIRRKKWEISRHYECVRPGCQKSYGSLSHLNAHVATKGHGAKRLPSEFSNLRRYLRYFAQYRP